MIDKNGNKVSSATAVDIDFMIKELELYTKLFPEAPDDAKGTLNALLAKKLAECLSIANRNKLLPVLKNAADTIEPFALRSQNIDFMWDLGNTFGYMRWIYKEIAMSTIALEYAERKTALFVRICEFYPTKYNRLCLIDCYKSEYLMSSAMYAPLKNAEEVFLSIEEPGGDFYKEQGEFIYEKLSNLLTPTNHPEKCYKMYTNKIKFYRFLYMENPTQTNARNYAYYYKTYTNLPGYDPKEHVKEFREVLNIAEKHSVPTLPYLEILKDAHFSN